MLPTLSSQAVPEAEGMTNYGAASDDNVDIMKILGFRSLDYMRRLHAQLLKFQNVFSW